MADPDSTHMTPDGLEEMEDLLRAERPVPHPAFRGELKRRLQADSRRTTPRPQLLWLRIGVASGSGFALLAIAALGTAGAGPFAA